MPLTQRQCLRPLDAELTPDQRETVLVVIDAYTHTHHNWQECPTMLGSAKLRSWVCAISEAG